MLTTIDQETTIIATKILAFQKPLVSRENTSGLYYLVFRTDDDLNSIDEIERRKFYNFIFGCVQTLHGKVKSIDGKSDSVEMLIKLNPAERPADFVKKTKLITSTWVRRKLNLPQFTWNDVEVSTVRQYSAGI